MLKEYGRLARVHSGVLTGLAPVLGALAVGTTDIFILALVFLIGFCTHIFGFVLNEYMDIDIDSKSKLLKDKPLVKGTISKNTAIAFAFSAIIAGYLLFMVLLKFSTASTLLTLVFYTLSWVAIGIYDLTSKLVRGSDLALALWTFSLCMFGGFAASSSPPRLLFVIAALAFFQLVIQNILAGLKDISHDSLGSGTTTPLRMGVFITNQKLKVPSNFQTYIYGLKMIHMVVIFIPIIFLWLTTNIVQIIIILLMATVNFILVFRMFNSPIFDRRRLLRLIGLHEILSYSIVPIMLYGIINMQAVLLLIVIPIVWLALFLKLLYGQLLPGI